MSIVAVMVARALSVYSVITPFNVLKMEEEIPKSWQHLLSW
jgi:NhaP-type Na+/H+ and K+/H+ antiporter